MNRQWQGGEFNPASGEQGAVPFPTEQQRRQDLAWTRKAPRPTEATHPYDYPPLAEVQAIWDAADQQLRDHEQYLLNQEAARKQRDTDAAAAREQVFAAQEARRSEAQENLLRGEYLAAGGTIAGWERDRERVLSDAAVGALHRQQARGGSLISRHAMLG